MSRSLFRALAARLAVVAVAATALGGLAGHAAATRPDPAGPLRITMHCFDPEAAPPMWVSCRDAT